MAALVYGYNPVSKQIQSTLAFCPRWSIYRHVANSDAIL